MKRTRISGSTWKGGGGGGGGGEEGIIKHAMLANTTNAQTQIVATLMLVHTESAYAMGF